MNYILGIDTGGSYTDSVVIEAESKKIVHKNKVLTTPRNLKECIEASFQAINPLYLKNISMVCLSTTLATNSIVENRGCHEGLILIGNKPNGRMPTDDFVIVQGRHDIKGRVQQNLNLNEIDCAVESFRGKVDSIAISGYASVRNPSHEIYIKKVVLDKLGIPVACAHELSSGLGFYERTITTCLNARLIPLICNLLESVKLVMAFYHICAPLMIVKGDGTLMSDVSARSKPIETVMSGPAASTIGGTRLSCENDCFILDIGGTTTDIAKVENGKIICRNEGARVGGWLTRVRAAEVFTTGLGGDSRIYLDSNHEIKIGPEKSIPLCLAGSRYPDLIREIADIYISKKYTQFLYNDQEAYIFVKQPISLCSDEDSILLETLRYYPHTLHYLTTHVKIKGLRSSINNFVSQGVLQRISLTPTDILHTTHEFSQWNYVISELGTKIAAGQCDMTLDGFLSKFKSLMNEYIDRAIVQAAMYFDCQDINFEPGSDADYLINQLFFRKSSKTLEAAYALKKKIIAIGAPAQVWLKDAGNLLHTSVIVPEHSEVANAYGAAVGYQVGNFSILIRYDTTIGQYVVFSPIDRTTHDSLDEATAYASHVGEKCVKQLCGSCNYVYKDKIEDLSIADKTNDCTIFIERIVHVCAALN